MDNVKAELNNIKSFLHVYNRVTEICSRACVDNFSSRKLSPDEIACVDNCFRKFSSANQRLLNIYVKEQATINQRRAVEVEKMEQEARLKLQQEEAAKLQESAQLEQTEVATSQPPEEPQVVA